jgi:hypothetical protein
MSFFDYDHIDIKLFSMASISQGEKCFSNITFPCYVAREIGIQSLKAKDEAQSEFIKLLRKRSKME